MNAKLDADTVSAFFWGIAVASVLAGLAVLGYQVVVWLKFAQWPEIPFSQLFVWLQIDLSTVRQMAWAGISKILLWILELPLSLMVPLTGIAVATVVVAVLAGFIEDK